MPDFLSIFRGKLSHHTQDFIEILHSSADQKLRSGAIFRRYRNRLSTRHRYCPGGSNAEFDPSARYFYHLDFNITGNSYRLSHAPA
jgi:hypothetical protein